MQEIEFSPSMTKKQLEQLYFESTGYYHKSKNKQEIISAIKRINRAKGRGNAFANLIK